MFFSATSAQRGDIVKIAGKIGALAIQLVHIKIARKFHVFTVLKYGKEEKIDVSTVFQAASLTLNKQTFWSYDWRQGELD